MATSDTCGIPDLGDHHKAESIPVKEFYNKYQVKLKMELVAGQKGLQKMIREKSINRPALALTGYFKHFAHKRIQLFGAGEMAFLKDLKAEAQLLLLLEIARRKIPCIVISRNLTPLNAILRVCDEFSIPLFRTPLSSKDFTAEATLLLEDHFAPRISLHGTLIDIRGIGVFLRGQSGVGKSECALGLIERGHSLVSDDITHIKLMGDKALIGRSSEVNRGYMECRGLGIINIPALFGVRAVRVKKHLDMVVSFAEWTPGVYEERTGLDEQFFSILGVELPHVQIYVKPGRDTARLVEVAAMLQALKKMGHDSAQEFNLRLLKMMA